MKFFSWDHVNSTNEPQGAAAVEKGLEKFRVSNAMNSKQQSHSYWWAGPNFNSASFLGRSNSKAIFGKRGSY